jgi:GNAT superfamily N-acetyltransferase
MPPGKRLDNPLTMIPAGMFGMLLNVGFAGVFRAIFGYEGTCNASKRECRSESGQRMGRHHYLQIIGTDSSARGQGLASSIIEEFKPVAVQDGLPVWLEATTVKSMQTYSTLGFETVKELRIGAGTHEEDGAKKKDGPGFPVSAAHVKVLLN